MIDDEHIVGEHEGQCLKVGCDSDTTFVTRDGSRNDDWRVFKKIFASAGARDRRTRARIKRIIKSI